MGFHSSAANNVEQGAGGWNSSWLNMAPSSGLTLQMDLIVSRNLILCHSVATRCPLWGPTAASRALINSTQGVEMRNWVLPQIQPWEGTKGSEQDREGRQRETGGLGIILQMLPLSNLDTSHTRFCLCAPVPEYMSVCTEHSRPIKRVMDTHENKITT